MAEWSLAGVAGARVREVPCLPASLPGAVRVAPFSVARPGALLRVDPGLGRFLASGGQLVEVMVEPGADRARLEPLLQGPLAAALIHQRGELPLHGAVLVPAGGGAALALIGHQGAGKSTLGFELLRSGWRLLSDDLTRLTLADGTIEAWPGRPGVKLCRDACARHGLDPGALAAVAGERDKRLVPWLPEAVRQPLGLIVVLDRRGPPDCSQVDGAAAFALISQHTFRSNYIVALGQAQAHLRMVAAIAGRVPLVLLGGPQPPARFADQVRALVADPGAGPSGAAR